MNARLRTLRMDPIGNGLTGLGGAGGYRHEVRLDCFAYAHETTGSALDEGRGAVPVEEWRGGVHSGRAATGDAAGRARSGRRDGCELPGGRSPGGDHLQGLWEDKREDRVRKVWVWVWVMK